MAIGWLAVLKNVPWTEVVNNAPLVADGARKLWKIAARKPIAPTSEVPNTMPASAAASTLAILEARIAQLEAAKTELQNEMATSSELIKALADQNTQLIQRIQTMRRYAMWLTAALAASAIAAVTALLLVLAR